MRVSRRELARVRAMVRAAGCALALALTISAAAEAQFVRFIEPSSLADLPIRKKEVIDDGMAEARWRLGRLRIDPRFEIGDFAYVDNVYSAADEEAISDLRSTVSGGLAFYSGLGAHTRLVGFGLARYDWWQEREELRRFSPSFGFGTYSYFNRLSLSVELQRREREDRLSSELEVPVEVRTDTGTVSSIS